MTTTAMKECAVLALAKLKPPPSLAPRFLASGWLLSLVALLEHTDLDVQVAAAAVLGELCAEAAFREAVLRDGDGALGTVVELLAGGQPHCTLAALRTLRAMGGAAAGGQPAKSAALQLAQAVCKPEPAAQLRAALAYAPAAATTGGGGAAGGGLAALRVPSALNPSAARAGPAVRAPPRALESLVSLEAAGLVGTLAAAASAAAELLAEAGVVARACGLLGALLDASPPVDAELACAAARALGSLSLCARGAAELREHRAAGLLARAARAGAAPLLRAAAEALGLLLLGLSAEASAAEVQLALLDGARAALARSTAEGAAAASAALGALAHAVALRGAAALEPKPATALGAAALAALRCREPEPTLALHALRALELLLVSPHRAAVLAGRLADDVDERLAELAAGDARPAVQLGARRALLLLGASAAVSGGLAAPGAPPANGAPAPPSPAAYAPPPPKPIVYAQPQTLVLQPSPSLQPLPPAHQPSYQPPPGQYAPPPQPLYAAPYSPAEPPPQQQQPPAEQAWMAGLSMPAPVQPAAPPAEGDAQQPQAKQSLIDLDTPPIGS
ncbi:hypothetical protein T492DRAFT_1130052 [Pavlovales sp. CCMP2436]|nr:hypothetical protein T492DRAFT_1130052 [Pavlovales sp. CCMP2436]